MKTVFFLIIFTFTFLFSEVPSFSQVYSWYPVPSGTNNALNFTTGNFITGANGTILGTTNGGSSWYSIPSGSSSSLNGMVYYSNVNLIVGSNGTILKSTNSGGTGWFSVPSGVNVNLNSISRMLPGNYISVGDNGTIVISVNDGNTWSPVSSGTSINLKSVSAIGNYVWVCGNNGKILYSSNSGSGWTTQTSGTANNLNFIKMLNLTTGWIVGSNGTIFKTTDGLTWVNVPSGTTSNLQCIDLSGYWAVGNVDRAIKSTDSGNSWFIDNNYITSDLNSVSQSIAAGNNGSVYKLQIDSLRGTYVFLNSNNISSLIYNSGIFNQDKRTSNVPGFNWPKGSGTFAIFTTGLTLSGYINNQLRLAAASYTGEYAPGYCVNGIFQTNSNFKLYRVSAGDNQNNNSDWANWGLMVPYGAPFIDHNHNGIYEPAIDTPGVQGAAQTIFLCMSDADPTRHSQSEGFSGGTAPLGAEVHLTAWAYNNAGYQDMQFLKWAVINKNTTAWDSTYYSIVADPDLGFANDDYVGCDSTRNLGYCYNSSNMDGTGQGNSYGIDPPAVGILFLNCASVNLNLSSFIFFSNPGTGGASCEHDPSSPSQAYNFIKGYKNDGTPWINILNNQPTKFCYSGDPEANTGWTEYSGKVNNCGGINGTTQIPAPPGDRRFVMNTRRVNQRMNPGDTQVVQISQLIARGTNNKNSVTALKQLSDVAKTLCQNGFVIGIIPISTQIPEKFSLSQNYPNPFNPTTKIKFSIPLLLLGGVSRSDGVVSLKIYNALGQEVATLVNEKLNPGTYEVSWDASNYPSGVYFYKLETGNYSETKKMVLLK